MSALQDAVKRFQSQQASIAAQNLVPGKPPAAKRKPIAKKAPPAGAGTGTSAGAGAARGSGGGVQPLGKAIKDVLDHLRLQGEAVELEAVADVLGVDLSEGGPLLAALRRNDKVTVHPEGSLQYKAKHQAKNKQQLLKVLAKHLEGIPLAELQEAYPAAVADITAARKEGKLYRLYNLDLDPGRSGTAGWMLYYRDPELEMSVSSELAELWRKTDIPRDPFELDAALTAAMLEPMIKDRKRKPVAKVPKERRKRKESQLRKVTNVHMPELFQGAAPTQID